ncbi:MAG: glycosyltransferase [Actinobacteria bacterium]|nr:glycosyltransferase [Actinomycetota bacterium]
MIDGGFVFDGVLTGLVLAQFALILWNRRIMRRPEPRTWGDDAPLVSLLVPARNEEDVIGRCLEGLLAQDYPNVEIVVMDDNSTDRTAEIVEGCGDPRVRLRSGAPLRAGWSGKNWACHQLAAAAKGDVLCFVDADTVIAPGAVSSAVEIMAADDAGLVSLLPRSGSTSFAGKVLLPMVTHALFGLFPIALIHHTRNPMLAVAFGPFLMVSRDAYEASGGHAAAPDHVVDDVQMSRNVKAAGFRVRIANGTDLVETRWYDELGEIWTGFSKNAYGALGNNPWMGAAVAFVLAPLLLAPFVRVGFGLAGDAVPEIAVFQCLLLLANRALTSNLGGDPLWTTPFHPVTVAFWGTTLFHSMVLYATNSSVAWKDRDTPIR